MSLRDRLDRERCLPFVLTAMVIVLDQVSKAIIVSLAPIHGRIWPSPDSFNQENLLQIIHVRNPAIAFSIGYELPEPVRRVLFVILPILVLVFLVWYYFRSNEFTRLQRWATAGILGGGIGNIADRIFRPDGVVDFISVRFFGIFGFERWPTFNVADMSVVISCLLLLLTIFIGHGQKPLAKVEIEPEDGQAASWQEDEQGT